MKTKQITLLLFFFLTETFFAIGSIFELNNKIESISTSTSISVESAKESDTIIIHPSKIPSADLRAVNDLVTVIQNKDIWVNIKVNDIIPSGCSTIIPEITIPSLHGKDSINTNISDSTLYYKPTMGFLGKDSLTYSLTCNNITTTAKVYFTIIESPENVIEPDCSVSPAEDTRWSISELSINKTTIGIYQTPLVGDIDGDGFPDIVTMNRAASSNSADGLVIFNGSDLNKIRTFKTANMYFAGGSYLGLVRTKVSETKDTTMVIVMGSDYFLHAYDAYGNRMWGGTVDTNKSSSKADSTSNHQQTVNGVSFIDFNKDGYAEIFVQNRIFDAATGKLLVDGGTSQSRGFGELFPGVPAYFTVAGDVLNKGTQQLVAGNTVYDVNITNRTGITGNSLTVARQLDLTSSSAFKFPNNVPAPKDGTTALADIDLDGNLDVIVITRDASFGVRLYVWSPVKNEVIAYKQITGVVKSGLPLIGDIDGDGYSEIVFCSGKNSGNSLNIGDRIYALKYNPSAPTPSELSIKWALSHTDQSGVTGMTLFDFNQDGITEIVYRGEQTLRVINGSGHSHFTNNDTVPYTLFETSCKSSTYVEMPVVADIDRDGEAEIIVGGNSDTDPAPVPNTLHRGRLRVFKSGNGAPWAPARPVWNQTMFNSVTVNDDLTIPKNPINPAVVFPGEDGVLGTNDDVRPFNAFLEQQTTLITDGSKAWIPADATLSKAGKLTYYEDGDSLTICGIEVQNSGQVDFAPPIYISIYTNNVSPTTFISTATYNGRVLRGTTANFCVTFYNFGKRELNHLVMRFNDNETHINQIECDTISNEYAITQNFWMGSETSNNWSLKTNWTNDSIPKTNEDIEFATVSNFGLKAKNNLKLEPDTARTIGNLINKSDKATIIPPNSLLNVNGFVIGSEAPNNVNKIQIEAAPNKNNGSFIVNCENQKGAHTDVYATVQLYAKGKDIGSLSWEDRIPGSPTYGTVFTSSYSWQYFGIPVSYLSSASPTFDGAYVNLYDESKNAVGSYYNKWTPLENSSTLNAFNGYEITQQNPVFYSIQGKLVLCDQKVSLTRKASLVAGAGDNSKGGGDTNINNLRYGLGQNIIGNSFTAAIPINKIDFDNISYGGNSVDNKNGNYLEKTVYIYNTGRFSDWGGKTDPDSSQISTSFLAGTFLSIPTNTANAVMDQIPSMQGFLLRHLKSDSGLDTGKEIQLTLPYGRLERNNHPQRAPQAPHSYLEIELNSESTIDKLWLFKKEGTSSAFDNGWDGLKFFGTPTAFIYSPSEAGNMQVNTTDNIIGNYIDFVSNNEKNYTLTIKKTNLDEYYPVLYLVDLKTNAIVPLNNDVTTYHFTAEIAGAVEHRFKIKDTAVISPSDYMQLSAFSYTDKIYVSNNSTTPATFKLYDAKGSLIMNSTIASMTSETTPKLETGVYIVNMFIEKENFTRKIVIHN